MRKLLFAFLLFCIPAFMHAQKDMALSVLMKDGTAVYFLLKERPIATFVDDMVKIESSTDEAQIKRTLVDRFEFTDELPTGIEDVEDEVADGRFELTKNFIRVEGLAPGCAERLYSVSGQMVMSVAADENGCATLSLDALASGIYLVNYNEITIKFIKS